MQTLPLTCCYHQISEILTIIVYSCVQALGMFSSALQSGQLAPLMGQFGFSDDVMGAARRGGKPLIFINYRGS